MCMTDCEPEAQQRQEAKDAFYRAPISVMCFWMASLSSFSSGMMAKITMLRRSTSSLSRNYLSLSSSLPCTAAGSGRPQWAVMGWPGQ
jgi:hypothetical protein